MNFFFFLVPRRASDIETQERWKGGRKEGGKPRRGGKEEERRRVYFTRTKILFDTIGYTSFVNPGNKISWYCDRVKVFWQQTQMIVWNCMGWSG